MELFDRDSIRVKPLAERVNKLDILRLTAEPAGALSDEAREDAARAAEQIRRAKQRGAARILIFGAHTIKNGAEPILAALAEGGWITHFATNGAGVIHDWEFARQGKSGEDVRRYTAEGQFGIWDETGRNINLAMIAGAYRGLGYLESVAAMIDGDGILLPPEDELAGAVQRAVADRSPAALEKAAAAADLLAVIAHFSLRAGSRIPIEHPFKEYAFAWRARKAGVVYTCHPMIGHDIIYTHPMNRPAAIGRCAERDFLAFVRSVSQLRGGVLLSVGSAVMAPMIFEKALSMARNTAFQRGEKIDDFDLHVVDLARSQWDWVHDGEPPADNPAYYLRFCKTFSRMGGRMTYTSADNRAWLSALLDELKK